MIHKILLPCTILTHISFQLMQKYVFYLFSNSTFQLPQSFSVFPYKQRKQGIEQFIDLPQEETCNYILFAWILIPAWSHFELPSYIGLSCPIWFCYRSGIFTFSFLQIALQRPDLTNSFSQGNYPRPFVLYFLLMLSRSTSLGCWEQKCVMLNVRQSYALTQWHKIFFFFLS